MCKNSLSSCTAAIAVLLFGTHFNAYAAPTLSAGAGQDVTGITNTTYEKIRVTSTGIIHGKDLKVVGPLTEWTQTIQDDEGNEVTIEHSSVRGTGVEAIGSNSQIYLEDTTIMRVAIGLDISGSSKVRLTNSTINAGQNSDQEIIGIKINDQSIVKLNDVDIDVTNGLGAQIKDESILNMAGGSITSSKSSVSFVNSSKENNKLENVKINAQKNGIITDTSTVILKNITVENAQKGLYADNSSQIKVSAGSFRGKSLGIYAGNGSNIILEDGVTVFSTQNGIQAEKPKSTITMTEGVLTTTGLQSAVYAKSSGKIDLTDVVVNAEGYGLQADDQEAKIIMTGGSLTTTGLQSAVYAKSSGKIDLTGVVVNAESNGLKIEGDQSKIMLKNSKVFADILLITTVDTKFPEISYVTADNSVLEGGARVLAYNSDKTKQSCLSLINGTKWLLKISTQEKDNTGNLLDLTKRSYSEVSSLNLDKSSIVFDTPTENHYQTLRIGSGALDITEVYKATDNAKIYFNTEWSDSARIGDQKTDRLLIHGDALGTTTVYFRNHLEKENIQADDSDPLNTRGISLIQVSGKANKNSFKLENGYTSIKGLPYKYTLTAYGPEANYGKANANQKLLESDDNFWDFRLQNAFLDPNLRIKALLPQTASYIVMPNALFYTGLKDIAKQNALLANIRTSVLGKEKEKQTGFFLYTYGSTATLSSERGPLKYGYGADIRYAALQAGVALTAIEGQNTTTHFGFVGTYGQLSFTPKDMADAEKNTLNKWSLTAYGSIQHDSGFYVDTLLSYGILKGHITNAIRGNTAKLNDAKMLSISTTVGKEFATGVEGLTFEPQTQIAYQHLRFNTIEDADNFTVDMDNPSQWLIRVGGRLTKTISTENNRPLSFYGKVNLIKTFGDDSTIHIGRNFDLDPMGPAIEGGIGINAQLSHKFSLHGDVSYQQKLQKTGISGASFSGGIRYQF
ncbi:autotransporter outer membrane beta-barrel domain-containing protein [Bartonella sp. OT172YNZD]|uniref:autotransporter family protein n=1 Tax=Bartonella sp. OT172YNZD TaxID=3243572 RepID=UPI0035CEC1FE